MREPELRIRDEQRADREAVRNVNEAAFGHPAEANRVEQLHQEGAVLLSLVADLDELVVGHILFSRMTIETAQGALSAAALAPMAVLPEYQRRQTGSRLVRHGLAELKARGERMVLVLGHRNYYPRFGFSCAQTSNLSHPFPADAFMALELEEGALTGVRGTVRYPAAFGL